MRSLITMGNVENWQSGAWLFWGNQKSEIAAIQILPITPVNEVGPPLYLTILLCLLWKRRKKRIGLKMFSSCRLSTMPNGLRMCGRILCRSFSTQPLGMHGENHLPELSSLYFVVLFL